MFGWRVAAARCDALRAALLSAEARVAELGQPPAVPPQ
eukprot:gene32233-41420_t